jgi:hypothetical protein
MPGILSSYTLDLAAIPSSRKVDGIIWREEQRSMFYLATVVWAAL